MRKPLRIGVQAFEKQTGFLQPRRFGTDAATPRRKVFGPDGNGVTRGGKKPEGQPPVLADADDEERLRPDFEPRRKQAPPTSADADDAKRPRPDRGPRRKQALTVRLSGSFPREPRDASASRPGGNDPRPQWRLRTMIASPSRAAGMVAMESRRNAHANRGQFRWNGERSPDHRKRSVTSHPDTAIASRPRAVRARMRPGSDPGPRLRSQ